MTPSEIIRAETLGAKMIKLFPGNLLDPEFMSSIKSLFPDLLFMPTDGVSLNKENIGAWFRAGVCAVGMGSKLISKQLLE
jgi:2-dehydro-3-deoxyphosphogluconate aldolase / (4S)-4-hydroxy-2-oxoglutarate aldolase